MAMKTINGVRFREEDVERLGSTLIEATTRTKSHSGKRAASEGQAKPEGDEANAPADTKVETPEGK